MKVKEIMTDKGLQLCHPETKLAGAAKIMKEHNCGALPVVDKQQKVVGIITDRDICLSLANETKNAGGLTVQEVLPKVKIRTVEAEDEITEALKEMRTNKVGRLPVVDKSGAIKGILSINNILSSIISLSEEIGQLKSKEENLAKTIKSIIDRNSAVAHT